MNHHPSDSEFEDIEAEEGRTLINSPLRNKNKSLSQICVNQRINQRVIAIISIALAIIFLVVMVSIFDDSVDDELPANYSLNHITQSWTDKVAHAFKSSDDIPPTTMYDTEESVYRAIDRSLEEFIDPLPSCSILNANITHNMLHHQWMIQHPHVHSDCSGYAVTGRCVYLPADNSPHGMSNPSIQARALTFTPKWMVFRINSGPGKKGTGGLADRLKGLLTVYGLSLLLGRSFALYVDDFVPFTATFNRGVIEWIPYESIPSSVRDGGKVRAINWQGIWDHRPLNDRETHSWAKEWAPYDIIQIEYNMNGFTDLMDHPDFFPAYRAFGFHAATEKGDMDVYWECLMDSLFSYTEPVLDVLNVLLDKMNRPHVHTWEERSLTVPTLNQVLSRQAIEEKALRFSRQSYDYMIQKFHQQSLTLYHNKFSKAGQPSLYQSHNLTSLKPYPLYCLQIRMGSNGAQETNNKTVGFKDFEGFLQVDQLQNVFKVFESKISSHLDNHPSFDRSAATLFITGDSDAYIKFIPESLQSVPMIVVPGLTAHIDMLGALADDTDAMLKSVIKVLATHYVLGECDVAYVTESGFGPTGLWRGRQRSHILHPFEDRVWEDKFMINKKAEIVPYVHMRGAAGREYDIEYRPIKPEMRSIIESEILVNQSIIESFRPDKHGKFQSSAQLEFTVPVDPACVKMKVFNL